jgi:hypothetical protein
MFLDRQRQYAPLKRRSTITLHGSISQKTTLNNMTHAFLMQQAEIILQKEMKLNFVTCNVNSYTKPPLHLQCTILYSVICCTLPLTAYFVL